MTRVFAVLVLTVFLAGCKAQNPLKRLLYGAEVNLETVFVKLEFQDSFKVDLGGSYPIKDYGIIEVHPSTATQPFALGFRLALSIFEDNDFLNLEPTSVLPNGMNIPVARDRAFVEVPVALQALNPTGLAVGSQVRVYVDVIKRDWLGFVFQNSKFPAKFLPDDFLLTQEFLKDAKSGAKAVALVFGADSKSPAGVAVFVNARWVYENAKAKKKKQQKDLNLLRDGL